MPQSNVRTSAPAGPGPVRERSRMRWTIVGFSALGLTIAYLDRAAISVAMPFMSKEFHISSAVQGFCSPPSSGRTRSSNSRPAGCSTASVPG